jgi:uncharacterized membrane protein YqaE (UPF0057 family)
MKIKLTLSLMIGLFLFSIPSSILAASSASSEIVKEKMEQVNKKTLKKSLKSALKSSKKTQPDEKKGVGGALLVILAIFIPPLAVFFKRGLAGAFWINILLTLLFVLPGIIHALIVVTD